MQRVEVAQPELAAVDVGLLRGGELAVARDVLGAAGDELRRLGERRWAAKGVAQEGLEAIELRRRGHGSPRRG
jgi:hypothetical protein